MKRLISAAAVCAVAVGLVAVPSAIGVKSAKQVNSATTVNVTPTTVAANGAVTGSGNVSSNSSCRKDRTVALEWFNTTTSAVTAIGTVTTRSNGDWTTTNLTAPSTAGTYTLRATVQGPVTRRVGGKKKSKRTKRGRAFSCLASPQASSSTVTVTP
jgi:hypothetical protein